MSELLRLKEEQRMHERARNGVHTGRCSSHKGLFFTNVLFTAERGGGEKLVLFPGRAAGIFHTVVVVLLLPSVSPVNNFLVQLQKAFFVAQRFIEVTP